MIKWENQEGHFPDLKVVHNPVQNIEIYTKKTHQNMEQTKRKRKLSL